jgi:putative transposase
MVGTPKTVNLKRTPTGKWFVSISCEYEQVPLPTLGNSIALDMGLENFATDQNGQVIENPNFFRKDEKKLAKIQRKMDKHAKGTPERAKARKAVAHCYEHIAWRRDNFCHQESRKIINKYQIICTEDLSIKKMSESEVTERNKSIHDVAWGKFLDMLSAKAVEAGRAHIKINPAYTSQDCSGCNQNRQEMPTKIRIYKCPKCGLVLHRDINAARNILRLGMQSLVGT